MSMSTITAQSIATARAAFGTREFTASEWDALETRSRLGTVVYHGGAERIVRTTRQYYTVAELVAALNECAGEDCYGCDWFYQVDESGRAFQDFETVTYRMT